MFKEIPEELVTPPKMDCFFMSLGKDKKKKCCKKYKKKGKSHCKKCPIEA